MIQFDPTFQSLIAFYLSPAMLGIVFCIILLIFIAALIQRYPSHRSMIIFDLLYEKVFRFYEDILWKDISTNIKTYIVTLFFVIFLANISSVLLDFIAPIFGISASGEFFLAQYIVMPTSDMQFNIALSLFSTLLLIYVQFGSLGYKKFFYNYLPFWGKWYIEVEQWKLPTIAYYPLMAVAKTGDIVISLFLGFLDLVGLAAKVISLAFRLFGNMTSGTILLGMLLVGMTTFSQSITEFMWGINFPVIAPLLVYAQWFLVAVIQAMVFPLLVAIFIRMAQMESSA